MILKIDMMGRGFHWLCGIKYRRIVFCSRSVRNLWEFDLGKPITLEISDKKRDMSKDYEVILDRGGVAVFELSNGGKLREYILSDSRKTLRRIGIKVGKKYYVRVVQ